MFFTQPTIDTTQEVTVSDVKNNLARTLEEASRGTEIVVTRHRRTVAVVVSPMAHSALRNFRRAVAQAFESSFRTLSCWRGKPKRGEKFPAQGIVTLMENLLRGLQGVLDVGPDRTVSTAEGGIDTYFFSAERAEDGTPARYVCLGVDSDSSATVLFSNGPQAAAEDLSPGSDARDLAARITGFLSGDDPSPTA